MYPNEYFNLFPPFPRNDEIFVAMSFDDKFTGRWENVIKPAIQGLKRNEKHLTAKRVDGRIVSDSILTEILSGISESLLIIADISTIGTLEGRPMRNANVLYEVGIAQATRLAEEILLFRSDSDDLLFDVSNIRVNSFDPDGNPEKSIEMISKAIKFALKERDLRKHLTVKRLAESFDSPKLELLYHIWKSGKINHPPQATSGEILGNNYRAIALSRLLEMGVIRTKYRQLEGETVAIKLSTHPSALIEYELSEIGIAVIYYISQKLIPADSDVISYCKGLMTKDQ